MNRAILAGLSFLVAAGKVSGATPTISHVSGSVAAGQTLTVAGANLLDEDRAGWDPFFTAHPLASSFEGVNPGADGYGAIGPSGGAYDGTVAVSGAKSMRFYAEGASSLCPVDNLEDYNALNPVGGDAADYWVRAYVRWNLSSGGWPGSHIKMLDCQGAGAQYYFQPAASPDGSLPTRFLAVFDSVSHAVDIPSGRLQNNRWYVVEVHWRTDAEPYLFDAWVDGAQVVSGRPGTPGSLDYLLFGLINLCQTAPGFVLDHWFDGLAVGSSRVYPLTQVELADRADYETSVKKYQEPLLLSDESVQVKADLTGLGSGPYYLFVTNNRRERSAAYRLGGLSDATPPAAPRGLGAE